MSTAPDLLMLFHVASHTLETEMTARLASIGVTPRANCVLGQAMRQERTQSELAELCNLDKTTMVVTVDELEQKRLAERKPSSTDRRARVISVTRAGDRKVAQGQKIIDRIQKDVLESLPGKERKVFLESLGCLVKDRLSHPAADSPPLRRREPRH
jgi:DNA-binding MarR family transcriptional regulator